MYWAVTEQRRQLGFPPTEPNEKVCRRSDTRQARSRAGVNTDRKTAVGTCRGNLGYRRTPYNTIHPLIKLFGGTYRNAGACSRNSAQKTGERYQNRGSPARLRSERRHKGGVSLRRPVYRMSAETPPHFSVSTVGDNPPHPFWELPGGC